MPSPEPGPPAEASRAPDFTVSSLRKGARINAGVYLVQEANFKQTRNGKHFIQLTLRDRTGTVRAVRWEATQEMFSSFQVDDHVRIDGRVEEFQQQPQVIVDSLARVPPNEVDHEAFLPVTARDLREMERQLLESIASVRNPAIQALLTSLVEDPEIRAGILRSPAGKALHHAYIGGLLEHVLSIIGAARLLVKNYPQLDAEILTAAAILHDIGKIRELSCAGAFAYTDEGQLVGHIAIGVQILTEHAAKIPDFPKETLLHLQHIILSHHGLPEHGAAKLPMTPEAIAFHHLDNLDAKLAMISDLKLELQNVGELTDRTRRWTDFKPALGRKIFFPE